MDNFTHFLENSSRTLPQAWDTCVRFANESYITASRVMKSAQRKVSLFAEHRCSPPLAHVVERVSQAVPETFIALSALWGGILIVPALLLSTARKITPIMPFLKTMAQGRYTKEALGESLLQSMNNLDEMFERVIVPSLFVACAVDATFSFAVGWLGGDWGRMLHGTAIAFPAACLALRHLMRECPSPLKPDVQQSETQTARV
jgi:hypothetical protein